MPAPLSQEREELIESLYDAGWSARRIASELGHGAVTVNRILRSRGFETKPSRDMGRNRQYNVDHGAFFLLNDEVAYWMGFLIADGCVYERGANLICALQERDVDQIHSLGHFLKSTYPLRKIEHTRKNGGPCVSFELRIRSQQICDDLTSWGITSRKSLTAKAQAKLCSSPHFWRGVFDGDGCISVLRQGSRTYAHLELTGSENICLQFSEFVRQHTSYLPNTAARSGSNAWRSRTTSAPASKRVLEILYKSTGPALKRKQERALSLLT